MNITNRSDFDQLYQQLPANGAWAPLGSGWARREGADIVYSDANAAQHAFTRPAGSPVQRALTQPTSSPGRATAGSSALPPTPTEVDPFQQPAGPTGVLTHAGDAAVGTLVHLGITHADIDRPSPESDLAAAQSASRCLAVLVPLLRAGVSDVFVEGVPAGATTVRPGDFPGLVGIFRNWAPGGPITKKKLRPLTNLQHVAWVASVLANKPLTVHGLASEALLMRMRDRTSDAWIGENITPLVAQIDADALAQFRAFCAASPGKVAAIICGSGHDFARSLGSRPSQLNANLWYANLSSSLDDASLGMQRERAYGGASYFDFD